MKIIFFSLLLENQFISNIRVLRVVFALYMNSERIILFCNSSVGECFLCIYGAGDRVGLFR